MIEIPPKPKKWPKYSENLKITDDAEKINRLNAPGFNGLVVAWNAWKEKWHKIKGDRGESAKNPPMLKLVSLLNSRIPTFGE